MATILVDLSSRGLVIEEWTRRIDRFGIHSNGYGAGLSFLERLHRDVHPATTAHRDSHPRRCRTFDHRAESLNERLTAIESSKAIEAERHLVLPELLLPMGILLTLAASYLIVKRRNARNYDRLDDDIDEQS